MQGIFKIFFYFNILQCCLVVEIFAANTVSVEEDWVHKNTHDRIASLLEDDWVHKTL